MEFDRDFTHYLLTETGRTPKQWILKALGDSLEILKDTFKVTDDDTIEYGILMKRIYTINPFIYAWERSRLSCIIPGDSPWVKSELESYVDYLTEEVIPDTELHFMKFVLKGEVYMLKAVLCAWPRASERHI